MQMHRKIINALIKWLENTVKICLLFTFLRLENFVKTGVPDLKNELFFLDNSCKNFLVIFEFECFCEKVKNGSIDSLRKQPPSREVAI